MSKGYVYILTNPCMPGIVKIGKTVRSVEGRAAELYQTGVPMPFEVSDCMFAPDCDALERDVHAVFASRRVNSSREFFRVDANVASTQLDALHSEMVNEWLDEFKPDTVAVSPDVLIDDGHLIWLSNELDAHPCEIVSAMSDITPEELSPFLSRWRERVSHRAEERRAFALTLVERSA